MISLYHKRVELLIPDYILSNNVFVEDVKILNPCKATGPDLISPHLLTENRGSLQISTVKTF